MFIIITILGTISIEVKKVLNKSYLLEFAVRDTGVGIKAELINLLG